MGLASPFPKIAARNGPVAGMWSEGFSLPRKSRVLMWDLAAFPAAAGRAGSWGRVTAPAKEPSTWLAQGLQERQRNR